MSARPENGICAAKEAGDGAFQLYRRMRLRLTNLLVATQEKAAVASRRSMIEAQSVIHLESEADRAVAKRNAVLYEGRADAYLEAAEEMKRLLDRPNLIDAARSSRPK